MKRFRITCTNYGLDGKSPVVEYVMNPMHETRAQAGNYAQYAAVETLHELISAKAGRDAYTIRMEVRPNDFNGEVEIYFKDENGSEHLYAAWYVYEIVVRDNTHTNYMYRGYRLELNMSNKLFYIYDNRNSLVEQAHTIRACCDIIDVLMHNALYKNEIGG